MHYYKIEPCGEEWVRPTQRWVNASRDVVLCRMCLTAAPGIVDQDIEIELDGDGYAGHAILLVAVSVPMSIVRGDLAVELLRMQPNLALGSVHFTGGTDEEYRAVLFPESLTVPRRTEDMSVFKACGSCGRQLGGPPLDKQCWIDTADVGNASVFCVQHQGRVAMTQSAFGALTPRLRNELSVLIIDGREIGE